MDPRYVRKETEIRVALLKLLETTPIADISTTALCKQAGISRNTFYCHYPSPAALLETWTKSGIALDVDDLELLFTYTTYGVERCIRRWSDNGFRESPEVLARKLRNMSEYMLAHYMEQPFI